MASEAAYPLRIIAYIIRVLASLAGLYVGYMFFRDWVLDINCMAFLGIDYFWLTMKMAPGYMVKGLFFAWLIAEGIILIGRLIKYFLLVLCDIAEKNDQE